MRKRLGLLTAVLGCAALAVGAIPAFTANSGSVVATVNVPPPPAPCVTVDQATVDFGTLSFSDPAAAGTPTQYASPAVRVASCATTLEHIDVRASAATTTSGGVWQALSSITTAPANTCQRGVNVYIPYYSESFGDVRIPNRIPSLNPGVGATLTFGIKMPCRGSVGAGESASMTFSMLAVLA